MGHWTKLLPKIALVTAAYLLLAKISLHFASMAGQVSPIWLPSGFTLAVLLLGGKSLWPGIAAGALILELMLGLPPTSAAAIAAGELAEAFCAWYLLRHVFDFRDSLERIRDLAGLIISSVLISIPLNAVIGATALCLAGLDQWSHFRTVWMTWWIANTTGCLTIAPAILVWFTRKSTFRFHRLPELLGLAILHGALLVLIFAPGGFASALRLEYGVFPSLIWVALRFRQRGAVTLSLLTATFAVWATVNNLGPFSEGTQGLNLLLLQTFIATVALTGMVLATITEERVAAHEALTAANAGLERRVHERTVDLSKANAFLNTLVESAGVGIAACDAEGMLTILNRQIRNITGIPHNAEHPESWKFPNTLLQADGQTSLKDEDLPLRRAMRGETVRDLELVVQSAAAESRRIILANAQPIVDEQQQFLGAVVITHDITARKVAEERLRHGARHDALTGLPNRAAFLEVLERMVSQARRSPAFIFAVLFLDLDRFKVINDSLGHQVGDELLKSVAQRLQKCVRNGDVVARLGGDEFTILLNDISGPECGVIASRIAERIQRELSQPFRIRGTEVFSGSSIGIATSSGSYTKAEEIVRDADNAMYRAKALGKGRYEIFDAAMHVRAMARLQLETSLRYAVERKEFLLHFQPVVSLADGKIIGFEALVRWNHPDRGLVPPGEFIPVAEETGLIVELGEWVLREACSWLAGLPADAHKDISVSVNLSPRQLSIPGFVEWIRSELSRAALSPHRLKLEITESALMDDISASAELLADLRSLGVKVHIDDFGTGYSSLSYLSRLPLDALKIDRSFVRDMGQGSDDLEIVRAIVALGHALGAEVIAEGIETEEQRKTLSELGCAFGQGYLFLKPADGAAACALLRESLLGDASKWWAGNSEEAG